MKNPATAVNKSKLTITWEVFFKIMHTNTNTVQKQKLLLCFSLYYMFLELNYEM